MIGSEDGKMINKTCPYCQCRSVLVDWDAATQKLVLTCYLCSREIVSHDKPPTGVIRQDRLGRLPREAYHTARGPE